MKIIDFDPKNNYVVLKFNKDIEDDIIKSKNGILLKNEKKNQQNIQGERISGFLTFFKSNKETQEKLGIKEGDEVIAEDYDKQVIKDDDNVFFICKDTSIKAIVKIQR